MIEYPELLSSKEMGVVAGTTINKIQRLFTDGLQETIHQHMYLFWASSKHAPYKIWNIKTLH